MLETLNKLKFLIVGECIEGVAVASNSHHQVVVTFRMYQGILQHCDINCVDLQLNSSHCEVPSDGGTETLPSFPCIVQHGFQIDVQGLSTVESCLINGCGGLHDSRDAAMASACRWPYVLGEGVAVPSSIQACGVIGSAYHIVVEGVEAGHVDHSSTASAFLDEIRVLIGKLCGDLVG